MKWLGLIAEVERREDSSLPRLAELENRLSERAKSHVLRYLAAGVDVIDVMEATPDPRDPGIVLSGGPSVLTDGEWLWRLDLGHYVERYGIELPVEFIAKSEAWIGGPFAVTPEQLVGAISAWTHR